MPHYLPASFTDALRRCRRVISSVVGVTLLSTCLSQCVAPFHFHQLRGDRAFISYTPEPNDSTATRLAVKDLIDVEGKVTTAGSEYFAKHGTPATQDAECLKTARARGVVIVGKTNLAELALGASGLNDFYGTPRNRLGDCHRLMPGGSSSGSAVAVASGKADIAFGTDTAGSVRNPAACCGIFGLKTTYGLVSLKGVYPLSPKNLDTVGPMARDVPRLVEGMDLLKPGTEDAFNEAAASHPSGAGLRVGRLYIKGTDEAIDLAVDEALKRAGFSVMRLDDNFLEAWEQAQKNGQIVAVADGYESNQGLLGERGVTTTTKAALLLGDIRRNSTTYDEAIAQRKGWQRLLGRTFERVDFIALPVLKKSPLHIPWLGRLAIFEAQVLGMQNTVAVNYAGNPAIAIPIPVKDEHVPLSSLQLIGPKKSEPKLLNAARIIASKPQ